MGKKLGRIFNIQKFSVHDGPGIRDLVFMKGCPLRCRWCANPESQKSHSEIGFIQSKCIGIDKCGRCSEACPKNAVSPTLGELINIDRELCDNCGKCAEACPAKAIALFGELMSAQDVLKVVQEQGAAWRANRGITVSGGEPLMQADFVEELLRECKKRGIETAIETSGYALWANVEKVFQHCDFVFFDVKCIDPEKHKKWIGVDNALILENLQRVGSRFPATPLIVRTPVVPTFNDTEEDVMAIGKFLGKIKNLKDYELLAYHAFGSTKYKQLGREYLLEHISPPPKEYILDHNQKLRAYLAI